jgi:hypothetical protein
LLVDLGQGTYHEDFAHRLSQGAPEVNASAERDGLAHTIGACPAPRSSPSSQYAGNSVRENSDARTPKEGQRLRVDVA